MAGSADLTLDDTQVTNMLKGILSNIKKIENGDSKLQVLMGAVVFKDIMEHFSDEKGSGGAWPEWSKSYRAQLEAEGRGGNKKLQFTGRLRQSFQPTNVRKTSEGYLWFNNAKTSGNFPYAQAHDEGGPRLPQREFMWLSQKAADSLAEQLVKFALSEGV